jgi:hypothetical protein
LPAFQDLIRERLHQAQLLRCIQRYTHLFFASYPHPFLSRALPHLHPARHASAARLMTAVAPIPPPRAPFVAIYTRTVDAPIEVRIGG